MYVCLKDENIVQTRKKEIGSKPREKHNISKRMSNTRDRLAVGVWCKFQHLFSHNEPIKFTHDWCDWLKLWSLLFPQTVERWEEKRMKKKKQISMSKCVQPLLVDFIHRFINRFCLRIFIRIFLGWICVKLFTCQ